MTNPTDTAPDMVEREALTPAQLASVIGALNFVLAGEYDRDSHPHGEEVMERALEKLSRLQGRTVLATLTPVAEPATAASGGDGLRENDARAYFERGFLACYAWAVTKREDDQLSDATLDYAWENREEGGSLPALSATPTTTAADTGSGDALDALRAIHNFSHKSSYEELGAKYALTLILAHAKAGLDALSQPATTDTPEVPSDKPEDADAGLREAVTGIGDDYMTSEQHHPGYVLIPTAKFKAILAALQHHEAGR